MRQSDIATLLKKYQIPTDRPLFVSFGRAGIHKGLDFAHKVGERLATLDIAYPVILGSDWGTRESENGRQLLSDKSTGSSDAGVVLTDFSFDLPKFLMQWNGTRLLAVFSRREPFGLIPSEFRVLNRGSGVIAVSNTGGLAEQVSNYIDGVQVDVNSINNASDICGHSLTEPKLDYERMHRIGLERVSRDYIMHRNILAVIKQLLKL
jgi:glycogen synthase